MIPCLVFCCKNTLPLSYLAKLQNYKVVLLRLKSCGHYEIKYREIWLKITQWCVLWIPPTRTVQQHLEQHLNNSYLSLCFYHILEWIHQLSFFMIEQASRAHCFFDLSRRSRESKWTPHLTFLNLFFLKQKEMIDWNCCNDDWPNFYAEDLPKEGINFLKSSIFSFELAIEVIDHLRGMNFWIEGRCGSITKLVHFAMKMHFISIELLLGISMALAY